jgi:2-dehydro-3-deoxygalactonokinase
MGERMVLTDGFIAADWGTTNRRAYRIDASGKCVDEFEDGEGILSVGEGGFPDAVREIRRRLGDHPLLLAGMIGSNRGWVEAPYVPCPAGIDELARGLVWAGEREAIVPGVSYLGNGRADVMRGEEVQLVGAVAAGMVEPDALVCHPGTHNKWVILHDGQVQSFRTVMTGELFSLLKEHSILAEMLDGEVAANDAFRAGVRQGFWDEDLPAELFAVRARVLLGQADRKDAASYTSGLLIGTDVRIGLATPVAVQVVVMGRPELTGLYAAAIEEARREPLEVDGERCFLAGIHEIAKRIEG